MKHYGLWELQSRNLVADFTSERDALALVWENIKHSGPEIADTLALDVEDENGEGHLIATGQELAELARREFSSERITG
jgi:hypothetical protein